MARTRGAGPGRGSDDRDELARLRESEMRYRLLADNARDLIIQVGLDGVIQYVSTSARAFGLNPEGLIGRRNLEFVHPDDQPVLAERLVRAAAGEELPSGADNEFRIHAGGGGDWIWVQGNPAIVRDDQGRPIGLLTILRDVSERHELEAALRQKQAETQAALERLAQSEASHRLITDAAADLVVRIDMADVIDYASPSARVFGYAPEDLVGRRSREFVHPEDRDGSVRTALMADVPLPTGALNQFRLRRKDGSWAWVEGNPAPIRNAAGEIVGVVNLIRDVTDQVALEDELRRKRAEAEAAAVAKSEFLANMSHEIRTPLTAVVGFAALMGKAADLPDQARVYLDRIVRSGEALTMIVNNVLDFSKIEAGQIELAAQPLSVAELARDVLGIVRESAAAKGLALTWAPDGTLPELVEADAGRLRQVLLNLLTNAVKFTRLGGVAVTASHDGQRLRIAVSDTGVGVPAEMSDRLFQRFSQIDGSNARPVGGTGLGLAISKGLVEAMGGEIGHAERPEGGSTFWFTARAPAVARPGPQPAEAMAETPPRARVLIVDDAPLNRELILALLSPFEMEVREASDGAEAVAVAEAETFDLVLMDLQMPGMDGIAATEAIRAGAGPNRKTPIIAVSASVQPSDVEACRRAGMNDHVPKPISARELLTKVARWSTAGTDAAA